jgi:hypothetical protein
MAGLFVFAAVLQYNDPDPLRWLAIYASAAVASILYVLGRLRWYIPVLIGLIALAWAATLASSVWGLVSLSQLFEAWEMANPTVEEGREMYGLLIVASWMAVLVIATMKRRSSPSPHPANG